MHAAQHALAIDLTNHRNVRSRRDIESIRNEYKCELTLKYRSIAAWSLLTKIPGLPPMMQSAINITL